MRKSWVYRAWCLTASEEESAQIPNKPQVKLEWKGCCEKPCLCLQSELTPAWVRLLCGGQNSVTLQAGFLLMATHTVFSYSMINAFDGLHAHLQPLLCDNNCGCLLHKVSQLIWSPDSECQVKVRQFKMHEGNNDQTLFNTLGRSHASYMTIFCSVILGLF